MFLQILIGIGLQFIGAVLGPKPKSGNASQAQEINTPTAEAGKTKGVVFGRVTIKDPNVLWYGDKATNEYKVKV